jgi:Spy/CpxP family protein refolding chaperone
MKRWIRNTLIATFGGAVVLGSLTACGGGSHHSRAPMSTEQLAEKRGQVMDRVSRKLDLNDAQKQRLGVLADKLLAQRAALIGQTTDPRAELQALLKADRFDRTRAQLLMEEKTRAVAMHSPEVISALADFYDSLNPEQQQKVRDMTDRRGWFRRG